MEENEKIFGICENKCLKEVLPKENAMPMENIFHMNGLINVQATLKMANGSMQFEYPQGFTNENIILAQVLMEVHDEDENSIWRTVPALLRSGAGMPVGHESLETRLLEDKIALNYQAEWESEECPIEEGYHAVRITLVKC